MGNYGVDQSILRLEREFTNNQTDIVILAVVPDTICRIVSSWKHYYEYGNTFAFKPRFILKNDEIKIQRKHYQFVLKLNKELAESKNNLEGAELKGCLLYTSPSPRDRG